MYFQTVKNHVYFFYMFISKGRYYPNISKKAEVLISKNYFANS